MLLFFLYFIFYEIIENSSHALYIAFIENFTIIIVQLFSLLVLHISIFREHGGFSSSRMKQVNHD